MMDHQAILKNFLQQNPKLYTEYELLKWIEQSFPEFFANLPAPVSMYKKHFWLFHNLYQLKLALSQQGTSIAVSALEIGIRPISHQKNELDERDVLSSFYLDIENLYLPEQEITEMQKMFWQRYQALNEKAEAIKLLKLDGVQPLTLSLIKKQYQKLAQQYHPDKGGDTEIFDKVNRAYNQLRLVFQK